MSGRHQQNDNEDEDDDEFLVTPRVRDRFGQGFSQYSQQRFDRPSHPSQFPARESHYSQRVPPRGPYPQQRSHDYYNRGHERYRERPYSHQRPYDDHYSNESQYDDRHFHQRPHDDYHVSVHRTHDTHFSEHRPYESYYSRQTTVESHRPLNRIPVRGGGPHHFPERSYSRSRSPPYRSQEWDEGLSHHKRREHSQNEPNGPPFRREGWLNTSPEKRHKFRNSPKTQENKTSQGDPLSNLHNSNIRAESAKSQQRIERQESPSEKRNQLKPDKIRHGNQTQTSESLEAKLKQTTVARIPESVEDPVKCDKIRTGVKDTHTPERDKISNNIKCTKELSESDKHSKKHSKEKHSSERQKHSNKNKHQRKLSERDKASNQSEHKREKSVESIRSFENRNSVEKCAVSKKRKEIPVLALHSCSDESDTVLNAERELLDSATIHEHSVNPCNQQLNENHQNRDESYKDRKDPMKKKEKMASGKDTERTVKKQNTNSSVNLSGIRSNSQTAKGSKVDGTISKMKGTASELLRMTENKDACQVKDKKEKSKEFVSRNKSESHNRSAELIKTSSSGAKHVSSKGAERKLNKDISSFDFATDIFTSSSIKSHKSLPKKDTKQSASHSQYPSLSEAQEKSVLNKTEKNRDHKTEQKHQKGTVDKNKQNKSFEKNTDGSDADAELNQFKSILTLVNDSRWKTKPCHIESRRSSSQSVKSTDSTASVSLLQSAAETKCLSQKAYRKFGATNLEYRKKKLYYRGVRIRQPVVKITKRDIQNVVEHKKMLKRKLQKARKKKIKFKRIKTLKDSSPEIEIDKRDDSSALLKSFDDNTLIKASSDDSVETSSKGSVSLESREFDWLVPDSYEESDWSDRTARKRKIMLQKHTKPKKRIRNKTESVTPPGKKTYKLFVKSKSSDFSDTKKQKHHSFGKKTKTKSTTSKLKHIEKTDTISNTNRAYSSDSVSNSEFETKSVTENRFPEKPVREEDKTRVNSASWKRKEVTLTAFKDSKPGQNLSFKKKAVNTKITNTFIQNNMKTSRKQSSNSVSGSDDETQFENINSDRLKNKDKTETESDSSVSDVPKVEGDKIETVSSDATVKTCTVVLKKFDKQQSKTESTEESGWSDNLKNDKYPVKSAREADQTNVHSAVLKSRELASSAFKEIKLSQNFSFKKKATKTKCAKPRRKESSNFVSDIDDETKLESIESDILKNKTVAETETEGSESDMLNKETIKAYEASKNGSQQVNIKESNTLIKSQIEDPPSDKIDCITHIPETQLSQDLSSSSEDCPFFQSSQEDKQNKVNEKEVKTLPAKIDKRDSLKSFTKDGDYSVDIGTEGTGIHSNGKAKDDFRDTNAGQEISTDVPNKSPVFRAKNLKKSENTCGQEFKHRDNDTVGSSQMLPLTQETSRSLINPVSFGTSVSMSTDNEQSAVAKVDYAKHVLSPKENIKKGFKTFRNRLLKLKQRQRKEKSLKPKMVKQNLTHKVFSSLDETGAEADIEDNTVIESLSESEDSDFYLEHCEKRKPEEQKKTILSETKLVQEPARGLIEEKDNNLSIHIHSMSEKENSNESVPAEVFKNDGCSDKVLSGNKSRPKQQMSISEHAISEGKTTSNEIADVAVKDEKYSLSSQSSYNGDFESEEIILIDTSDIKIEATDDMSPGYADVKPQVNKMLSHENQLNTTVCKTDKNAKVEQEPNIDENKGGTELSSPASLLVKQISKSAEENQTAQNSNQVMLDQKETPSVNLFKVKEEHVKIKEEPEWKFSYTQEPDAIFISDVDDNTSDIITSQIEAFQVDSDSNDSDFPLSSQARHLSMHDSEMQDPEYYDFSSPENSENEDNGHSDNEGIPTGLGILARQNKVSGKEELSGAECTKNSKLSGSAFIKDKTLKQENKVIDDDHAMLVKNRDSEITKFNRNFEDEDDIEESFSDSEISDDANYVEINSCEIDGEGNVTEESEEKHKCRNSPTAVNILDEEPPSYSQEVSTVTDSFDPYSYETQVEASRLPSNKRISAIIKAVINNLESQGKDKYSSEGEFEDEIPSQKESALANKKKRHDFLDDTLFEANTQIRKRNLAANEKEHDAVYDQAAQIDLRTKQTILEKGGERTVLSGSGNLDENTFSDSSLVDAADMQTDLYIQCRVNQNESRSRFAEGLRIRYQDDEFMKGPVGYFNEGAQTDKLRVEDRSTLTNETGQRKNIFGNFKELTSVRGSLALNNDAVVGDQKGGKVSQDEGKTKSHSSDSKRADAPMDTCDGDIEMDEYSINTQVDAPCERTSSPSTSDENEVKTARKDEYAMQTQKISFSLDKRDNEIDYVDDHVQPSVDENRNMTAVTGSQNKNLCHISEQRDGEMKNKDSGFNHNSEEELPESDGDSYNGKSAYGALTQTNVRPSSITLDDSESSNYEDAYANMTQVDIRHSESESLEDITSETDKGGSNAYFALTQKDPCLISSDSENDQYYFASTQVDITCKKEPTEEDLQAVYDMETQIEADSSHQSEDSEEQATVKYTEESNDKGTNKSELEKNESLTKNLHSTVLSRSSSRESTSEAENKLFSLKDKLKQSAERKTIEIPMQKAKSYHEKKFAAPDPKLLSKAFPKSSANRNDQSRRSSTEETPNNISNGPPVNVTRPLDDVTFHNATKSDMWLSKNTTKPSKPTMKPPAKRKRRATGDTGDTFSFKKSLLDARRQLADRNYQTIFKPDKKPDTQRKQKLDIPPAEELEDVDLPTCSQIVSKGLPILNPTGMLVKKTKPQSSSSRFSSRAASLTESMVESKPPQGKDVTKNVSVSKTTTEVTSTNADGSAAASSLGPQKTVSAKSLSALDSQKNDSATSKQAKIDSAGKIKAFDSSGENKSADNTAADTASKDIAAEVVGKDKAENEKLSASGKQRKRRLSRMSQNSEYMPDTKALKTVPNTNSDAIPGPHKAHKSNKEVVKKQHSSDTCSSLGQNSKQTSQKDIPGTSARENASRLEGRKTSSESRDKTSNAQPFRRVGGSNIQKHTDNERNKMTDSVKTAKGSSSVNSEKTQGAKAVPAWKIPVKDTQRKPESALAGKAVKKVTFAETMPSNKNTSNVAPEPNVTQSVPGKRNPMDPRLVQKTNKGPEDRVNLMLKTPLQSSDLSRQTSTGPQSRPPQPFQVRCNREPAPAPPNPAIQEKGITYREFLAVLLRWSPLWFDEHAKHLVTNRNVEPPPCTNGLPVPSNKGKPGIPPLYPLLENYTSFKEYSNSFMVPLLLHETWESSFQTWREKQNRKTILKHKFCLSGVRDGGVLNEYVLLGMRSGTNQFFVEGDLVILDWVGVLFDENNTPGESAPMKQLALVEKVIFRDTNVNNLCRYNMELARMRKPNSFSVKMILKTRGRKFNPDYKFLGEVVQVGSIVTTLRQFKALELFQSNPLCCDILLPTGCDTFCDQPAQTASCLQGFNTSQQRAISTASLMVSRPNQLPRICLLQGPPGTGKSHTVLGIINQILKDKQQKARICLCAQSHAAVDELLKRLDRQNKLFKQKGIGLPVKLIRIGKPSSVHEDVQYLCLDRLIEKNLKTVLTAEKEKQLPQSLLMEKGALEKKIKALKADLEHAVELKKKKLKIDLDKLKRERESLLKKCQVDISQVKPSQEQERTVKYDLLNNAQVIAGTLNGIGSSVLKQFFESRKENRRQGFDCIIIDEATQAIELDTLIPLQYGTTKLILVGDPEQLPAVVVSQVAIDNKFNLSLFERLNSHFRFSNYNPVIMLDTQYRMDPQICSFPSNYIYDGKLKTDSSIYSRSQCPLEPYLLFDIEEGREQLSQCSGSVSNPVEALFTVRLVEYIVENTSVTTNVIGIIAPYQKQKALLVKHLQDSSMNGLHEIEVSTVDGFQGREKHVIIMSCVRAKSSSGTIGFLGSRNRMNVSLTRAKYALYVIAHFDSLEKSDEWKALIDDANKRKKRIPVNESSVEKALRNCLKRHASRPP